MRSTIRLLSTLTIGAVVGVAVQTPLAAQGTRLLSAPAMSAAQQLEAQAATPKETAHDWVVTAQALEQAARLRPAADPLAVHDLIIAATAYSTAHRPNFARSTLEEAASRAEKANENMLAAQALEGAYHISMQMHDDDMATLYLDRLIDVMHRPGVTEAQRHEILGPLGYNMNDWD